MSKEGSHTHTHTQLSTHTHTHTHTQLSLMMGVALVGNYRFNFHLVTWLLGFENLKGKVKSGYFSGRIFFLFFKDLMSVLSVCV